VWRDETDLTQLAQRLHVGPRELWQAIGGPWMIAARPAEDEQERAGTLFVGRSGALVGILVADGVDPAVEVSAVDGMWPGPGALEWVRRGAVRVADGSGDPADLLVALAEAVDATFLRERHRLVLCRYCGRVVGPWYAHDEELCDACAADLRGVVF
jgi:hypothetical protein